MTQTLDMERTVYKDIPVNEDYRSKVSQLATLLREGKKIVVFGEIGSGKSVLIEKVRHQLQDDAKKIHFFDTEGMDVGKSRWMDHRAILDQLQAGAIAVTIEEYLSLEKADCIVKCERSNDFPVKFKISVEKRFS